MISAVSRGNGKVLVASEFLGQLVGVWLPPCFGEKPLHIDQFELPIVLLDERACPFDPVAAVGIHHASSLHFTPLQAGLMDMSAHDTIEPASSRMSKQHFLESADESARALDSLLDRLRETPASESNHASCRVDDSVECDEVVVRPGTDERHKTRVLHDEVVLVAMSHEQTATIRKKVFRLGFDGDSTKFKTSVRAERLIMVARDIGDLRAATREFQQTADHLIVRCGPVPSLPQHPHVHNVAHEVDAFTSHALEECRQFVRATTTHAQMHIAEEYGAVVESHRSPWFHSKDRPRTRCGVISRRRFIETEQSLAGAYDAAVSAMVDKAPKTTSGERRREPVGEAHAPPFLSLPGLRFQEEYVWLLFLASMDVMLTWYILEKKDGEEVNPVARVVIEAWGLWGAIAFKFSLVLFVIVACEWVVRRRIRSAVFLVWFSLVVSVSPVLYSGILLAYHWLVPASSI